MGVYSPQQLGIKPPKEGFQELGWYGGRQYVGGTLSEPNQIHPNSPQQGAGQEVSQEVRNQSAAAQGVTPEKFDSYLNLQKQKGSGMVPVGNPIPGGSGMGMAEGGGDGAGIGISPPAALNLPDLYKSLYEQQGVAELEKSLYEKSQGFTKAQSTINDNPFLAEASRVGRISKLTTDYNSAVKNDQDALVMKKQDIATQLDIATKQFDINSQAAKQALDQFNVLLSSGALAGATGNDIAAITKATGISSSMISSAINTQRERDVQTSVSTVDDGQNIYSVVINSKTGQIISKQPISASKPTAGAKPTQAEVEASYKSSLRADAASGVPLSKIFSIYSGYLDPNLIYQLYNANSKYGPDKGDANALKKYGVTGEKAISPTDQYYQKLLGGE